MDSTQQGTVTITGDQISAKDPDGINPVEFSVKSGGEFFFFEDSTGVFCSHLRRNKSKKCPQMSSFSDKINQSRARGSVRAYRVFKQ